MQKPLFVFFFAAIIALGACSIKAQEIPPPPPTISAAFAVKASTIAKCVGTDCSSVNKFSLTGSHVLQLTPEQEQALQSDTTVTVISGGGTIPLLLGSDPNFENGDTSAKVNTVADFVGVPGTSVTAKLKWGNGTLSVRVKAKGAVEAFSAPVTRDVKDTRALTVYGVGASIDTPTSTILTAEAYLAANARSKITGNSSLNGDQSAKASLIVKTGFFTNPPAP